MAPQLSFAFFSFAFFLQFLLFIHYQVFIIHQGGGKLKMYDVCLKPLTKLDNIC